MSRRIRCINILLLLASITLTPLASASQHSSTIHKLDETTFEHDTQASTGQTTGVWLIRFCTKHSQCTAQRPSFLTAANHLLNSNILSASVDTTASPSLAARFHITKTPAFILLKDKKMYRLSASIATIATEEDLIHFATNPPLTLQKDVPPPLNIVSKTILLVFDKIKQSDIPILSSSESPAVVGALAILTFVVIAPLVTRLVSTLSWRRNRNPQKKQD